MPSSPLRDRAGAPPLAEPYLNALDRMQERGESPSPAELVRRAQGLLEEQFGTSQGAEEAAFAHGPLGLASEHTHFFDGFALFMPLPFGAAVAMRLTGASASRVVFEGMEGSWTFDGSKLTGEEADWPPWVELIAEVVRHVSPDDGQVEVAVVSTIPSCLHMGYLAAMGVAAMRASQALFALSDSVPDLLVQLQDLVTRSTHRPFSIAHLIASEAGQPGDLTLVDAASMEHLPVNIGQDVLGWGLVVPETAVQREAAFYRRRRQQAERILHILQDEVFSSLSSFRELEHRQLQRAVDCLPPALRPVLRYLVTENRRVQKLVAALQRNDAQLTGALLLMGHASLRDDWNGSNKKADHIVGEVEAMSLEGLYGARLIEPEGCVLVTGQPFSMPSGLDAIAEVYRDRFGELLGTTLL